MGAIHKCVQELKTDLERKKDLEKKRSDVLGKISKGQAFFDNEKDHPAYPLNGGAQVKRINTAVSLLSDHIKNLLAVESDIVELDNFITLKLEALFTDFLVKFELPTRLDESGDQTNKQPAIFVPFVSGNPDYVEITPEDLKFVILLRDRFNVRNLHMLETVSKEEYYQTGGNNL